MRARAAPALGLGLIPLHFRLEVFGPHLSDTFNKIIDLLLVCESKLYFYSQTLTTLHEVLIPTSEMAKTVIINPSHTHIHTTQ